MKKLTFSLALCAMALTGIAQNQWTTNLNHFDPNDPPPMLGTRSATPLDFYTDDTRRMTLDLDGNLILENNLRLKGLSDLDATYSDVLMIDANGLLTTLSRQPGGSSMCSPGANPWAMGGNTADPNSAIKRNVIGTCNNVDFIMKAGDSPMFFMRPASEVNFYGSTVLGIGLGNSNPKAQLDITDAIRATIPARSEPDHTRIYGNYEGVIEATGNMALLFQDGFSIGTGLYENSTSARLKMDNTGHLGLALDPQAARFALNAAGPEGIHINQGSASDKALGAYDATDIPKFSVYGNGRTVIGTHSGANTALLNINTSGAAIDVSDGSAVNFRVNADGTTFARELEIMVGTFPDYVFDDAYELKPLSEVEAFISRHKHLPGFEEASYYETNGVKTSEMIVKQQEKIEELTLYIIALEKRLAAVESSKK